MLRIPILLLASVVFAAPAAADSLTVTPTPVHAKAGKTVRVAYSGAVDGVVALYATVFSYVQPGRAACAPTQRLETNRPSSEQLHMFVRLTPGAFKVRRPMVGFAPGLYRLCAYLQHTTTPKDPPDALATALVRITHS